MNEAVDRWLYEADCQGEERRDTEEMIRDLEQASNDSTNMDLLEKGLILPKDL